MVTSTMDQNFIPQPEENVGFRVGNYGRFNWSKHGKDCWLQRFPSIMVEMEWPPDHMIAYMDAIGVDKGVLQAGYMEINYCREYYAKCMKKWPDRFIGTLSIDYDIDKSEEYRKAELKKLRDSVLKVGMRGVCQGFPRSQRDRMDDGCFDPFWEELTSLEVPHIFIIGFEPKSKYLDSLNRLERVLKKFPDLKGVIGHLGGNVRHPGNPDWTDTPKELLKILKLPNAYFEVGYVLAYENWNIWGNKYEYPYPLHTNINKIVYEEIGAERLLWSSDMPNIYRTCTYQQCLDLIRLHCDFMSDEHKNLVLGGNADRLYGTQ